MNGLLPPCYTRARHFHFNFKILITPSTNLQGITNKQLNFSPLKILGTTYHGDEEGRSPALEVSQVALALGNGYGCFNASVFVPLPQSQFLVGNVTLKDPK